MITHSTRITNIILSLGLALILSFASITTGFAQQSKGYIWRIASMEPEQIGPINPVGLSFSYRSRNFYVFEDRGQGGDSTIYSDVIAISPFGDRKGFTRIAAIVQDPLNLVFDNRNSRLLAYLPTTAQLLEVRESASGNLDRTLMIRHNAQRFGIHDPQGLTIDERGGVLFILDAVGPRIVRVVLGPGRSFTGGLITVIDLKSSGLIDPRGIAFDPTTGHLHVLDLSDKKLYELAQSGLVVTTRDLTPFALKSPQGMVFAPSVDQTDDPSQMSLFLADSGSISGQGGSSSLTDSSQVLAASSTSIQSTGQIVEFSLVQPESLPGGTTLLPSTLVHIIDTSNAVWNPSAPDPAGVDYWPLTGRLLIGDSEVDEMSNYFTGKNVFDATTSGALVSTCSTTTLSRTGFSNEPTGVAINPNNNRIYFSDDDANKVHEVSLGPDGIYCTADDGLTTVNVGSVYNIQDAEDVAYGNNTLFIAGGADGEVYMFNLGPNGVLGGGDDGPMTHFDTTSLGFSILEGLGYNWDNGTLLLISDGNTDAYLGEATVTGTLLKAYNLNYSGLSHREDVTFAPGSQNPAIKNLYVVDRGTDNNSNPSENDGQIWEINIYGSSASTNTPLPPTATNTPTNTPLPPTATNTPTNTPLPPTATNTPTNTPLPTATYTPTNTPLPTATYTPTNTPTFGPSPTPTDTPLSPTATNTPTNTPIPPAATPTFTPTNTPLPSTATQTSTPTNTPLPPTATPTSTPTNTPLPPTATATPTNTPLSYVVTFTAVADARVLQTKPTTNYGTQTRLDVDSPGMESNIRFTVNGVTGAVQSATLRLFASNGSSNGPSLYLTDNSWTETGITWDNRPAPTSGMIANVNAVPASTWAEYDLSAQITGNGTYNFVLLPESTDGITFNSREGGTPPQLVLTFASGPTLTYTPIPPTNTPTMTPTTGPSPTLTNTATSTSTPTPTHTPTLGPSPTPTNTSLPTATPTSTSTYTPLPPTATPTNTPVISGLTFAPVADSSVYQISPDTNSGTSSRLDVDDPGEASYIRFVVSGVIDTVQSATLRLLVSNGSSNGPSLYFTDNTWTETGITWNNRPAATSGAVANLGAATAGTWAEYNLTAQITGDGTYNFVFLPDSSDGIRFDSREGGSPPQLVLTFASGPMNTPTPGPSSTPTYTPTPTSTPSLQPVVFVGAGDIADCSRVQDEQTAQLLDNIPGTVYTLGDNVYPTGSTAEFNDCYQPTWGRHKARTYPAIADGEYGTSGASGYFNYFGAAAGDPTKGYYSYNLGNWHIVVLNSECSQVGGCGVNSPQWLWLQADLASNPVACTLAIHHKPMFSSNGGDANLRDFWTLLYQAGADVVLSGHRHMYERFAQQNPDGVADLGRGIRQFVAGTGGASLSSLDGIAPNSVVRNDNTYGVLKFTLYPTSYDWQFIPIAGQTFTDSGSALCVTP